MCKTLPNMFTKGEFYPIIIDVMIDNSGGTWGVNVLVDSKLGEIVNSRDVLKLESEFNYYHGNLIDLFPWPDGWENFNRGRYLPPNPHPALILRDKDISFIQNLKNNGVSLIREAIKHEGEKNSVLFDDGDYMIQKTGDYITITDPDNAPSGTEIDLININRVEFIFSLAELLDDSEKTDLIQMLESCQ